ncbi:AI-2E family transporter [Falsirhodobacter algicola]|uniref:AI-2E family transporter n=1 Tax=Falsirhodobacter algicola TaxID=2692330 RepID=A0A8J8MTZ4_9RHOB|nr:AI-2E family transporter [Falsirhodobacter algicola]QUS36705.1 AI-2E family transporter [Falsirhodobacter algicola]
MRLTEFNQAKWWGVAAFLFLITLWFLGDVILPFLVGGAVAYFLDPVADRLERLGLNRAAATAIIAILGVVIVVLLVLAVIPTLISQLTQLINVAPDIFRQLQTFLLERFPQLNDETSTIRQTLDSLGQTIQQRGGQMANTLITSVFGVINAVVFIIVVPVVAFYMLLDWDKMVARIDALLPLDHAPTIRELAKEIDRALAGFVRGQTTVCLVLGIYYAVALMAAGLNFGAIVGAIAGFLTFIPYVGALVGGGLAIGLALFQFWGEWWQIILVWAIFQSGQFVEGNILTPRLVGHSVGLHPVWLLFALSAFGAMFGFVGLLVAVPVAAAIGVLARFGLSQYRASRLYHGVEDRSPGEDQG